MGPTQATTDAERSVIKWFFGAAFLIATVFIGYSWVSGQRQCVQTCRMKGFHEGSLELNRGSRLDIGSHCVCE